jgi:Alcohol dehydrogenase GroES-like domain
MSAASSSESRRVAQRPRAGAGDSALSNEILTVAASAFGGHHWDRVDVRGSRRQSLGRYRPWPRYVSRHVGRDVFQETIGSLDGLVAREEATPVPSAGEVLIRVKASALNFRDLAILLGKAPFPVRAGVVPISDAAGEVEAVGPDVSTLKVGDHVFLAPHFRCWSLTPALTVGGKKSKRCPLI